MEHPPLLLDVLGQPVRQQAGGGVVHHDVWPLAALHGMDRCQRDSTNVGRDAQLFRKPPGKPAWVAFEVSQFGKRVAVVTVGASGAVAP